MARLKDKIAIITGAAQGQGAAEARLFAREGAKVVLADIQIDLAEKVAAEINREHDGMALAVSLDVASESGWNDVVQQCQQLFGGIDILVNNAALVSNAGIEDLSVEEWDRVNDVNQKGVWLGMKAVVPAMRSRGGGSIVNISSIYGLVGVAASVAYCAAKGGVRMLTKVGAASYAAEGIRVNLIYPGVIQTPMTDVLPPEILSAIVALAPIARIGLPEEVAAAALFLASDEASFVVGAELAVDGGYSSV